MPRCAARLVRGACPAGSPLLPLRAAARTTLWCVVASDEGSVIATGRWRQWGRGRRPRSHRERRYGRSGRRRELLVGSGREVRLAMRRGRRRLARAAAARAKTARAAPTAAGSGGGGRTTVEAPMLARGAAMLAVPRQRAAAVAKTRAPRATATAREPEDPAKLTYSRMDLARRDCCPHSRRCRWWLGRWLEPH